MKHSFVLFLVLALVSPLAVYARDGGHGHDGGNDNARGTGSRSFSQAAGHNTDQQSSQPVVINMSHPSSGGHNRNFPAQQPAQQRQSQVQQNSRPSYGQVHWSGNNHAFGSSRQQNVQHSVSGVRTQSQPFHGMQQQNVRAFSSPGLRAANVVHHHSYTPGYVRQRLRNIGVSREPGYITDRSEIIHTNRNHSSIRFPQRGPDNEVLAFSAVSPRHFNVDIVRHHMNLIDGSDWHIRLHSLNLSEYRVDHYYWHKEHGFNYCHYIDNDGYHWYGWYVGKQYFWNRFYNNRWWWYDPDFDRWCFWNNGFWWWQDPYHIGDLYCYNNNVYIPSNSAEDQVVVTAPDNSSMQSYVSPDGTRTVKVDRDTQDAFLYNTSPNRTFDPVYLASGVKNVQFSDTGNGRPLEIILTLNDGTFDMFDGQGNAYNLGTSDTAPGQDDSDGSTPPNGNPPAAPGR